MRSQEELEKEYQERVKWFTDRVGKVIWRTDTHCCSVCEHVYKTGLLVSDEYHAKYVADCSMEGGIDQFMVAKLSVLKRSLDRLDKVTRWASLNGWSYSETPWPGKEDCNWVKSANNIVIRSMNTEWLTYSELYELYKEKNQ